MTTYFEFDVTVKNLTELTGDELETMYDEAVERFLNETASWSGTNTKFKRVNGDETEYAKFIVGCEVDCNNDDDEIQIVANKINDIYFGNGDYLITAKF